MVVKRVNDVVYLIQQTPKCKAEVQHIINLKPCYSKVLDEGSWLPKEDETGGTCPMDKCPSQTHSDSEASDL